MSLGTFNQYASIDMHSQWGEDGIISQIIKILDFKDKTCCEFGAADGLFCSNTANLWINHNWNAFLYEQDKDLFNKLRENVKDFNVEAENIKITDIDSIIDFPVNIMSIDVDGLDLEIFERMQVKHDVVIVEHNPTFPTEIYFRGGEGEGSSIASICKVAEEKGYFFLTSTTSNVILVNKRYQKNFSGYNLSLRDNFDCSGLNYVVTDYKGNYDIVGILPFGMLNKVDLSLDEGKIK